MFIKKLAIKNYRLFPNDPAFILENINIPDGITEGSGITAFVGENGCGKTSLLEAMSLTLLQYKAEGFSINDFNDYSQSCFIELLADQNFNVASSMPRGSFLSKGFSFEAKLRARSNKAYLSSIVVNEQRFIRADGNNKPEDNHPDLRMSVTNPFRGQRFNDNDIIYLDKNRTYQTRAGTYNTTRFDRLMEDFDYQYVKNQENVINFNQEIHQKTQNIENKFLTEAITKFCELTGIDISINYIDNLKPFSKGFFAECNESKQINLNMLGSGYEMMFALVYSYYLSQQGGKKLILLIDEPELHLHPALQNEFVRFLLEISKEVQIILSSQSPLFIKQLLSNSKVKVHIIQTNDDDTPKLVTMDKGVLSYISANEINYLAFDLPTEEYHNELYGYIQEIYNVNNSEEMDLYFGKKGISQNKKWIKKTSAVVESSFDVTLQTYIRHSIHHPENTLNSKYSQEELKTSIDEMIEILRNL